MKKSLKLGVFVLLSLVMLSFVSGGVNAISTGSLADLYGTSAVSSSAPTAIPAVDTFKVYLNKGLNFFGFPEFNDDVKVVISEILLILLLFAIIYALTAVMPFFETKNTWLRALFSAAVVILAFIFVPQTFIKSITETYMAMGVMIVTVIPLIILIAFNIKLNSINSQYEIVNRALIVGFFVFLIVAWVEGIGVDLNNWQNSDIGIRSILDYVYPLTMLLTVIWFFASPSVYAQIKKHNMRGEFDVADRKLLAELRTKMMKKTEQMSSANKEDREILKEEIASLREQINELVARVPAVTSKATAEKAAKKE